MKNPKIIKFSNLHPPTAVLTIRDVAQRLQVSERTVHRLIAGGELRAVHIGRSVRVTEAAILALLTSGDAS